MAEWWPFDRFRSEDWKRSWTDLVAMSSAAAASVGLPQPGTLPGDPFAVLIDAARAWLVGKKKTIPFSGHDLTLTLTDISVGSTDLARVVGQYGQVSVFAKDAEWGAYQFERVAAVARNVHLRPGIRPTLVAAPVLCEAFVSAAFASRWLAAMSSQQLELIMVDGVPQVGVVGVPWLRLELQTDAQGQSLRVRPRALHLLDWRLSLWSPAFFLAVPGLPDGFMLTSVDPAPGGFGVRGQFSEWQQSLSRDVIERLLTAMRSGTERLDL
jgi:hypothetical protein